ncbi:MAG: kynureninase [Planctomycetes bacterium]|nr:kynureninase [Planctomycetota bacterium]
MGRVEASVDTTSFRPDEEFARRLDADDPLRAFRDEFEIPRRPDGEDVIYLCGNSLGLQPKAARRLVEQELDDWARRGVEGHFTASTPWYSYHEQFREAGARLVGARSGGGAEEVVMMNSLTVNLHLMMVSFFRPSGERRAILTDWPTFPSDIYALKTHLVTRGLDPGADLIFVRPRDGEHVVRPDDLDEAIAREGKRVALILMNGVNFLTGQAFDLRRITRAGHEQGCLVGFDLAHAAGNVELHLHDWDVDFACWCSYKYLNAGPGAVGGCFVHERHGRDTSLPRYAGWWGNDPETRFRMQLEPDFVARGDVEGWQLSNPPILALAPLRASLEQFSRAGMPALAAKSRALTAYLRYLLEHADESGGGWFEIITPREPGAHGCQLSVLVHDDPRGRYRALEEAGVVCDFREPNIIRVAPVPLYNTFHDAWRFARILTRQSR